MLYLRGDKQGSTMYMYSVGHKKNAAFIMAARQLAGRRPLYFTADVSIILLTFFRRLISEVSGPIVTKLCHMFDGDCNF